MKTIKLLFILVLLTQCTFAQKTQIKILASNNQYTILDISLTDIQFDNIMTSRGKAHHVILENGIFIPKQGAPNVPKIPLSITIPLGKKSKVEILSGEYTEYNDMLLAPSKGKIYQNIKKEDVPYIFGEEYSKNEFYPKGLYSINTPFYVRKLKGQTIQLQPIQYNGVTQKMRIYYHVKIKINFISDEIETPLMAQDELIEDVMLPIYQQRFLNFDAQNKKRYTPLTQEGSMLILTPAMFLNDVEPFVIWKEQKGIKTFVVNVDTLAAGVSETSIFNVVKQYFTEKNILYVLILGDDAQIPPMNMNGSSATLLGPSDNAYGYQVGNDHDPDIIVGRFSGSTTLDIQTQVNRTIKYEKTPNISSAWYTKQAVAGSDQGPGDDWQYDYQHLRKIADSNISNYNYTMKYELFDGSQGGADAPGSPVPSDLLNVFNDQIGLMYYCGHGSVQAFSTSGFGTSDVVNMTNTNGSWPAIFSTACLNGNFLGQTCLGEELLQARSGNQETGAIATLMSIILQSWDPPMEGQDEIAAMMQGARPGNYKTTFGSLAMNGCLSVNQAYNDVNVDPNGGNEITDTWEIFGDPSVELKTGHEGNLACTHGFEIGQGHTDFKVNSNIEGASIGLYYKNKYWGSGKIVSGVCYITNGVEPVALGDTLFITGTKQNYMPYFGWAKVVNVVSDVRDVEESQISISPNPTADLISIQNTSINPIQLIRLYDMEGKLLLEKNADGKSKASLSLKQYPTGNYILELHTQGGHYSKKVTKQ
ncbi:MAG: C25 family cysteine peptidase [Chitinophagaceae bacterium]